MEKAMDDDYPHWQSFSLSENDCTYRWFYTNEKTVLRITDKEWFNKATTEIIIHKGYETEEYSTDPISDMIYCIEIEYQILNYFGDKSGMHFRRKEYMLVGGKLYKQERGYGIEVKRVTRELKGVLEEIKMKMR